MKLKGICKKINNGLGSCSNFKKFRHFWH